MPEVSSVSGSTAFRLDPRSKLALTFTVTVIMVSGKFVGVEYVLRVICAAIPFVLLLFAQQYKTAFCYFMLLAAAELCEGFVIARLSGIWNLLLMILCGLISRFVAGYMMGRYMIRTTSVSEFITAMERMHVPLLITIPLSVMFRYFPTLTEEASSIRDAMRMREIGESVKNPLLYMEYILVPIMMSTVRIADELSAASMAKGLGSDVKRTHICEIRLRLADWLLILLSVILLSLFFVY